MINLNALLGSLDINGHFDPTTLSISETIGDKSWRERINFSNFNLDKLDSLKETSDRDLLASLTSMHEQEHFHRYTSSEIGLFITFLLQLRSNVLYSYALSDNESLLNHYVPIYNTILNSFYTCNHTQQEAVDALNMFYTKFSEVKEQIFITKNPTAPSSPHAIFGFNNILEASAVLSELAILTCAFDKSDKKILELLRPSLRLC